MNFFLFRISIFLVIAAFLSGCASTGSTSPEALAEQIKRGMTKDQVIAAVGKPQSRQTGLVGGQGDEVWLYSDGALNLIPVYGLVRGGRTNMVQVFFKNGKVVRTGEGTFGLW